jgi:TRAP-type mannitol/chloroaromatic compound transport system permease small subunit
LNVTYSIKSHYLRDFIGQNSFFIYSKIMFFAYNYLLMSDLHVRVEVFNEKISFNISKEVQHKKLKNE